MSDTSEDSVLPTPASTSVTPPNDPTATLGDWGKVFDDRTLVNLNAQPTNKSTLVVDLPKFTEKQVTGYVNGSPQQFTAVQIGGYLVEKNAGTDFVLMQRAAASAGITLNIVSAWRSYEEQDKLRKARVNPDGTLTDLGKVKGIAAKPGYSNHQSGISLDLDVKMTVADLANGRFSAEFLWLKANCAAFGFERNVSSEPWHYTHTATSVVGAPTPQVVPGGISIDMGPVIAAGSDPRNQGLDKYQAKDVYDRAQAYFRSFRMASTDVATHHANATADNIAKSATVSSVSSTYAQVTSSSNQDRPSFNAQAVGTLSYDFDSGTWGDGSAV